MLLFGRSLGALPSFEWVSGDFCWLLYYAARGYWISGYCGLKVVFAGGLLVSISACFVVVDFCVFRRRRRFWFVFVVGLRALALFGCVFVVVSDKDLNYDDLASGLKEALQNDKFVFDADRLQKYTVLSLPYAIDKMRMGIVLCQRREALEHARPLNVDLVKLITISIALATHYQLVCYVYLLVESEVTLRKGDCKEVQFSVKTEQKDLQMKADTVERLMDHGY
ncbi:hypothetical protein RHGRI_028173 [Rhododendron griersonianum]|uniref:Uncharacterized protein n=1 Tax=Rhododendron griersonianum TaxID=479676 RepID=A0AAV6IER5_9ERIC|nr:hypothetical protein RHGRI_028173 [Rhododendron griersonianum]KAG5527174.1 hypothetical protein RHGRI_028173 [Rhododendron griersonianum]